MRHIDRGWGGGRITAVFHLYIYGTHPPIENDHPLICELRVCHGCMQTKVQIFGSHKSLKCSISAYICLYHIQVHQQILHEPRRQHGILQGPRSHHHLLQHKLFLLDSGYWHTSLHLYSSGQCLLSAEDVSALSSTVLAATWWVK